MKQQMVYFQGQSMIEWLVRLIYIGRVALGQRRLIGMQQLFKNHRMLTTLFTALTF